VFTRRRSNGEKYFKDMIPRQIEFRIADSVIRIPQLSGYEYLDFEE